MRKLKFDSKKQNRKLEQPEMKEVNKRLNDPARKHKKRFDWGKAIITILISCNLAIIGPAVGARIGNYIDTAATTAFQEENLDDYLMQTPLGSYMKLPIDENPIAIVLGDMTNDEKKSVYQAIETLDNISTNIDYTILEKDDVSITNKIYITANDDIPADALATTTIDSKNFSGKIQYPIHIEVDMDRCHTMHSDITGEDAVSAVVKHEMAHTLGFKDLYEPKYMKESIMYYSIYQESYTESDERRIRAYYGGEAEDRSAYYNYDFEDKTNEPATTVETAENGFVMPAVSSGNLRQKVAIKNVRSGDFYKVYEPTEMIVGFENDLSKTLADVPTTKPVNLNKKAKKEEDIIEIEKEM